MNRLNRAVQLILTSVWVVVSLCVMGTPVVAGPQNTNEAEEEVKSLIVMVICKTPEGKTETVGAGIIFGVENDRFYVATAAHVIRQSAQEPEDVQVKFRWLKRPFKAKVLRQVESPLDLAVLTVTGLEGAEANVNALLFDRLGDTDSLKLGDPVYSLGNPHGEEWSVNKTPDTISKSEDGLLYYESNFIRPGHSGGALLDEGWELVGMIVADNPPIGRAVSITKILATLRDWKYPVGLRAPNARVSAGNERTCAVMPKGFAQCWGNIEFDPPYYDDGMLTIQTVRFNSISAGESHVCGIAYSGAAYCWGANATDQLGSGSTSKTARTSAVPVQGGLRFTSVSAGGGHTCGLTTDSSAYCWGHGNYGQLGNDSGEDSPFPVPVSGGLAFKSVSAGFFHTCGITTSGAAYCWGSNEIASLGGSSGPISSSVPVPVSGGLTFKSVSAGYSHSCAVTVSGAAYCWGSNEMGQLGNGSGKDSDVPVPVSGRLTFKSVSAAIGGHSCGVTTGGVAYCWGSNSYGQLGNGTKTDNNIPVVVSGGLSFASISAGHFHSCGVTTGGSIYCWGADGLGGFGTGSKSGSTKPIRVDHEPASRR